MTTDNAALAEAWDGKNPGPTTLTKEQADHAATLRAAAAALLAADEREKVVRGVVEEMYAKAPRAHGPTDAPLTAEGRAWEHARETIMQWADALTPRPEPAETMPVDGEVCRCPEHGNWIAAEDCLRLVRELDVLLNGVDGAAKQARLCDIVSQVARTVRQRGMPMLGLLDLADRVIETTEPAASVAAEPTAGTSGFAVWPKDAGVQVVANTEGTEPTAQGGVYDRILGECAALAGHDDPAVRAAADGIATALDALSPTPAPDGEREEADDGLGACSHGAGFDEDCEHCEEECDFYRVAGHLGGGFVCSVHKCNASECEARDEAARALRQPGVLAGVPLTDEFVLAVQNALIKDAGALMLYGWTAFPTAKQVRAAIESAIADASEKAGREG